MGKQFILGSKSPRRQQILSDSGYSFQIVLSEAEEVVDISLSLEHVPEDLARQKAAHILPNIPNGNFVLLTADTLVILDQKIIGKPVDRADAISILERLSGSTHDVISGVCLADHDHIYSFSDRTSVTFLPLSAEEIRYYVDHFEVMDKAGAHAIQEWIGLIGIFSIEGSYYNVMGLPIHRVYKELSKWDIKPI